MVIFNSYVSSPEGIYSLFINLFVFFLDLGVLGVGRLAKECELNSHFRVVPGKKITAGIHPPKAVRLRMQATEVLTQAVQSGCPLLRVWVDVCFRP